MALTVQTVINDVNIDVREYFGAMTANVAGASLTPLISWVDRVHKDVLHTSVWSNLLVASGTFTSSVNGSPYTLTTSNIRRILSVQDLANKRTILPYTDITFPAATGSTPERSGPPQVKYEQTQKTSSTFSQYYIFESSPAQKLHLLPDPFDTRFTGTIRYIYTGVVATLVAVGDTLVIPEDGRDIIVAGVNMYAANFIKSYDEAERWRVIYESMKKGF